MTEPTIAVTLQIENIYEGGDEIQTTVQTGVPKPPLESNEDAYQRWADNHILPHTGTGRAEGNSAYFVKIVSSSDPDLLGREFEWGT